MLFRSKDGFSIPYKVVVQESKPILAIDPNAGMCPPNQLYGGIAVFNSVSGTSNGQIYSWCLCDTGLCPPVDDTQPFPSTQVGSYTVNFVWDGHTWSGPSDTMQKPGAPFPPGIYELSVTAQGQYQTATGKAPYSMTATLPIQLTP